ncbi:MULTISPECIES: histidinol phosphate aminotransferase [unclassified Leisingera]|uniref:histidinol phosphate aminotransferase n=1 Tax=unclassified Leisingera TaxID=2614906 RepID=UPI001012E8FE|nr:MULTISPECIES: histidinol phosphate aminotransferase [unclassified Leisingera]MBQ4827052.1 histidinol phosphate aminotransferase [Leisingera sp. HS039]MCF6433279.1 histidinol phosphate aminotransferase [Leisingera sp. MMG026]QAX29052.1 histidinol phosphate aminotransferase [Leisingera sp. NJS204]QBR36937.1 histidinol phosphate aminotransferase [Leisingera sp. NJS201]UWQ76056.1 histidinol phosphate aminotransferase [Leisingera sp. M658]
MRDPELPANMPDFFTAAITFAGINLMWIFFVVWVMYGMVPVLVLAVLINHLITRLDIRLNARKA